MAHQVGHLSPEYRALLHAAHAADPTWGTSAQVHADWISEVARAYKVRSILDYGCGKGVLADHLKVHPNTSLQQYDPGIDGFDVEPHPADMVVCLDVLEHVEPEHVEAVIKDLGALAVSVIVGTIANAEAIAILPDGRNAHLIVEQSEFWLPLLVRHMEIAIWQRHRGFFQFVAEPRK